MKKKQNEKKVENIQVNMEVKKIKPYDVKAYKVFSYTSEELDKLANGEKVLTAEEMEELELKKKRK